MPEFASKLVADFNVAAQHIARAGRRLAARGWAPATAGNYSMRLENSDIAITVSGKDKGELTAEDVMVLDAAGKPRDDRRPSAEAELHHHIYATLPHANAVLHTHSPHCTALSRHLKHSKFLRLAGYEVLKAFPGISTHDTSVTIPVVENSQHMPDIAGQIAAELPTIPAYIIRSHGLYAWGRDMAEALRVTEGLEFLIECYTLEESMR